MPERRAASRKRESPSTRAGQYVHEEIDHVRQGKHGARSAKQAVAIGLSKARRAGVKVPPPRGKSASRGNPVEPCPFSSYPQGSSTGRDVGRLPYRNFASSASKRAPQGRRQLAKGCSESCSNQGTGKAPQRRAKSGSYQSPPRSMIGIHTRTYLSALGG